MVIAWQSAVTIEGYVLRYIYFAPLAGKTADTDFIRGIARVNKLRPYPKMHDTAVTWAASTAPSNQLGYLADFLAEMTAPMRHGLYLDDQTWAVYAAFGCRVCQRLGHAICEIPGCVEPGCPLGLWEGQFESEYAAQRAATAWFIAACARKGLDDQRQPGTISSSQTSASGR